MKKTNWPKLLKALRIRNGWTQREAAAQVPISQPCWAHWEAGRATPRIGTAKKLRDLLGITIES